MLANYICSPVFLFEEVSVIHYAAHKKLLCCWYTEVIFVLAARSVSKGEDAFPLGNPSDQVLLLASDKIYHRRLQKVAKWPESRVLSTAWKAVPGEKTNVNKY